MDPPNSDNGELVNRVLQLRLDPHLARGTGSRGVAWLPWTLFILLALAWAGVGIRNYKNSSTVTPGSAVNLDAMLPSTTGKLLDLKGYLVPARQIAVSPIDVSGRVVELNVIEGKKYKKGDVLARIEDTAFKALVAEAAAGVAAAERKLEANKAKLAVLMPESVRKVEMNQVEEELKEAEAMRARALDEVTRLTTLGTTGSEKEFNQAKFDLKAADARVLRLTATLAILREGPRKETKAAAEAEVKSAEAEVTAAKARLAQADWRLSNCTIVSPINGTVLVKKAELYNLANPNAFSVGVQGGASGSICEMADLSDLEVEVEIPERDLPKLAEVKACKIKPDAYPAKSYDGRLDRVMPVAVRGKSIVMVRVKVTMPPGEEPGIFLKPEMGVVVSFLGQ